MHETLLVFWPPVWQRPATGYTGSAFANGLASRTLQRRQEELEHEKQAMVATYAAAQIQSAEQKLKNSEQRLALAQFEMQKDKDRAEQVRSPSKQRYAMHVLELRIKPLTLDLPGSQRNENQNMLSISDTSLA